MSSPCPGPSTRRHLRPAGKYLCPPCWSGLSRDARRQLSRRGAGALDRLRQLHDQLAAGVPLAEIRIE